MTHSHCFLLATRHSSLATVFLLLFAPSGAHAQGPATGTPPFGSFNGGPDVINLANLNAHWTIPVIHKPGRGTNFGYDLVYDSSVWMPVASGGTTSWLPVNSTWGWNGTTPTGTSFITYSMTYSSGTCWQQGLGYVPTYTWNYGNYIYFDQFGISHNIGVNGGAYISVNGGPPGCPPGGPHPSTVPWTGVAADGSGYTLQVWPSTGSISADIVATNGAVIYPPVLANPSGSQGSYSSTDRNGNQITSSNGTYTDTLGTQALAVAGLAPSNTTFTYTAPSGASAAYTLKYTTYTVQTIFGCSNINDYGPTSTNLVSEIDLPDWNATTNPNSKYTFTYETTPKDRKSVV